MREIFERLNNKKKYMIQQICVIMQQTNPAENR